MMRQWVQVRYQYENPEAQQRARSVLLVAATLAWAAGFVLVWAMGSALFGVSIGGWPIYAMPLAVIVITFWVRQLIQRGHQLFAAHIIVSTLMLVYLAAFFIDPSAQSAVIVGFMIPVAAAAFLAGPAAMFLVSLIMGAVIIVTVGIQIGTNTYPELVDPEENAISVILTFLTSLILLFAIAYQYILNTGQYIRRSYQLQQALTGTSQVETEIRNLSEISDDTLRQVVEAIREAYAAYYVQLFLMNDDNRMVLRAATGLIGERMVTQDVLQSTGSPALAFQRKVPILTTMDTSELQRANFLVGTRAEVAVPLLSQDQVIGLLVLQSEDPSAFSQSVIDLLEGIAIELTLVVQRWRLQQQVAAYEKRLDQNSQILDWYQREVNRLTQEIQGQVWADYVEGQRASTSLRWEENQLMPLSDVQRPVAQRPTLETTEDGRQVLVVPIRHANQLIGEMVFEAPAERGWSRQTLDLAVAVSNRLALALENLRLFEQAQRIASREQTVSRVAAELQDARDIELLLNQAVSMFNQVLKAEQTHIRLGTIGG